MIIQQGDQYYIPIQIKTEDDYFIKPDNIDDIIIQLGDYALQGSKGELGFDTEENMWLFPVTAEMTRKWIGKTKAQTGIKVNGMPDFIYTPATDFVVGATIIPQSAWGEGEGE